MAHIPVLLKEVLDILNPASGKIYVDGTTNGGGHAEAIIEKMMPEGTFVGVDWDKNLITATGEKLNKKFGIPSKKFRTVWTHDNYANIPKILEREEIKGIDGLLLDLGFSSEQLDSGNRGFAFMKDEPLDMRYAPDEKRPSAAEVVNSLHETELADIIFKYGEERLSRRIAKSIVEYRRKERIVTTQQLVSCILAGTPKAYHHGKIHPATRTFQALRIYVNGELENLETILGSLETIMNSKGRVAIISFHSLEDRLVKNAFRELVKRGVAEFIVKKPIQATGEECCQNPRSRSAKLRGIIRI